MISMKTDHPAWGYRRREDGGIESRLFQDGRPEGWADSPDRVDHSDAPAARLFGKPDAGKQKRTSEQVAADEALLASAEAFGVQILDEDTFDALAAKVEAAKVPQE